MLRRFMELRHLFVVLCALVFATALVAQNPLNPSPVGPGGGGSAGIGGTLCSVDNTLLATDGTGGATAQCRDLTVSDVAASTVTVATTAGNGLAVNATAPAATTGAAQAGKAVAITASNAVASTDTVGGAAGGAVTITAGDGARLTSGTGNGGIVTIKSGTTIGPGFTSYIRNQSTWTAFSSTTNNANVMIDGSNGSIYTSSTGGLKWSVNASVQPDGASSGYDTAIVRDGIGTVGIRYDSDTNSLNTYTVGSDTTNYERLALQGATGYVEVAAETGGTGADNVDVRLTPAGTGMVKASGKMVMLAQFGEITATPDPATPIVTPAVTVAGTYVEVAPTTSLTSGASDFDQSANGRLRYTGAMTQKFHCAATLSYKGGSASADVVGVTFGDNGTPIAGAKAYDSATNANIESTALHAAIELAQNEYVSIWITNETDTDDPAVHSLNVFCMAAGMN